MITVKNTTIQLPNYATTDKELLENRRVVPKSEKQAVIEKIRAWKNANIKSAQKPTFTRKEREMSVADLINMSIRNQMETAL